MQKTAVITCALLWSLLKAGSAAAQTAVTTYHYDNLRTGWNQQETTLTATNFPQNFGLLQTVDLDDQVDAQPLIVPSLNIAGGTHDVVYVATESNTIYAIDAPSGAILKQRNLGAPVPESSFGCPFGGPNLGINSTPVIDLNRQILYAITYVNGRCLLLGRGATCLRRSPPGYQLHALSLSTLEDQSNSPLQVTASHTLTDGSTLNFDATIERQRPALLLVYERPPIKTLDIPFFDTVYAGFGSFCDYPLARGWLLGWGGLNTARSSLAPLPANQLDDTQTPVGFSKLLSSIWMAGYGIASTGGDLFFATGNSDGTYDGITDIQESVVKLAANLSLVGTFTPMNVTTLDEEDLDLGAGGVMLLPPQSGNIPNLAVAAGKDGNLFLLNRDAMSPPGQNPGAVLDQHQLGGCWCGPSYFTGSDGVNRVVTSQGVAGPSQYTSSSLVTWKLVLSPSPHLVQDGTVTIQEKQDPGFFTVVSSNGTQAGTAIIWAVGRPNSGTQTAVTLYAFDAASSGGTLQQLFSAPAGSWPNTGGDANIVPVVANGKVYVASAYLDASGNTRGQLAIFGVGNSGQQLGPKVKLSPVATPDFPHVISGTLLEVNGPILTLKMRTGESKAVNTSNAINVQRPLNLGVPFTALGSTIDATGALVATSIVRAKRSGEFWPPDR